MLMLGVKVGECIRIGAHGEITVKIQEVRKNYLVRLAITAPREVPVHRQIIFERLHGEQQGSGQDAAGTSPGGVSEAGGAGRGTKPRQDGAGAVSEATPPPPRQYQDRAPLVRPNLPENAFADF